MHGAFSPRHSCASNMVEDEEGDFFESMESLKQVRSWVWMGSGRRCPRQTRPLAAAALAAPLRCRTMHTAHIAAF